MSAGEVMCEIEFKMKKFSGWRLCLFYVIYDQQKAFRNFNFFDVLNTTIS